MARLTICAELLPDRKANVALRTTVERINAACEWLFKTAGAHRLRNQLTIQQMYYRDLREQFGFPSQMAMSCIRRTIADAKQEGATGHYPAHRPVLYDKQMLSFKGLDQASVLTVEGRVLVPLRITGYIPDPTPSGLSELTWQPKAVLLKTPSSLRA